MTGKYQGPESGLWRCSKQASCMIRSINYTHNLYRIIQTYNIVWGVIARYNQFWGWAQKGPLSQGWSMAGHGPK